MRKIPFRFSRETISSLTDFFRLYRNRFSETPRRTSSQSKCWAFRGMADIDRKMETSLERACSLNKIKGIKDQRTMEHDLIREFTRRYQGYSIIQDPPNKNQIIDWMALMQHHGAPTRLLDWTYSYFIAAFFAVEQAVPGLVHRSVKDSVIWAIELSDAHTHIAKHLNGQGVTVDTMESFGEKRELREYKLMFMKQIPFVSDLNPLRLNQRLTLQQGLFLCPGKVGLSFEENLAAIKLPKEDIVQIRIKSQCRPLLLMTLQRMNVTRADLFPGIDGFAASLSAKMLLLRNHPSHVRGAHH